MNKGKDTKCGMTSKERIIAAIRREETDYVPCVPFVSPLTEVQRRGLPYTYPFGSSQSEAVIYMQENFHTDMIVQIHLDKQLEETVSSKIWYENGILHKRWDTPSGSIHSAVRYTEKWPYGYDIGLGHDFEAHNVEPWLKTSQDIECIKHLIQPVSKKEDLDAFRFKLMECKNLADKYDLPVMVEVGCGITKALQLFGPEVMCVKAIEEPELIERFLEIEHEANMRKIELAADLGIDILRRNGFYESCDFLSPKMLEHFLKDYLISEARLIKDVSKVSVYTLNTNIMPMLDYIAELEFDGIINVDMVFGDMNLEMLRDRVCDKKSILIGPSSPYHMCSDNPEVVRDAVRRVFQVFGNKGLLLGSCASMQPYMPWENMLAMVDEWKKLRYERN